MASRDEFTVRFWGVRGSIACPGALFARYGGNTSCLEVRCGGRLLIFDGGTGLRPLGLQLKRETPVDADLFFTHTHLDHIVGIPFFMPLFDPVNTFRLWAGHLGPTGSMRQVLCTMMTAPLFPVPPEIFTATTSYIDFAAGETLAPQPGVSLRTAHLNHPNGATGYRIEFAGKSVCYVTDTEHEPGRLDGTIVDLVRERGGVDDPVRRREILEEAVTHIDNQLTLVRRRRDEIAQLEGELTSKKRRLRDRLRELQGSRAKG